MLDEKQILLQCIKNDSQAQRILYEKYAAGLLGVCMRFTGNRPEAEDILQEGFVKVFLNIKDFEGRSSLIGWMRRIVINTAITHYHKNLKHQYHADIDDIKEINKLININFTNISLNNYLDNNVYPEYPDRQQINDTLNVIKDNVDDIREVVNK